MVLVKSPLLKKSKAKRAVIFNDQDEPFFGPPTEGFFLEPMEGAIFGGEELGEEEARALSERMLVAFSSFEDGSVASYTLGPGEKGWEDRTPWAMVLEGEGVAKLYRYSDSWRMEKSLPLPYYLPEGVGASFAFDSSGKAVVVLSFSGVSYVFYEEEGELVEVDAFEGSHPVLLNPFLVSGNLIDFSLSLFYFTYSGKSCKLMERKWNEEEVRFGSPSLVKEVGGTVEEAFGFILKDRVALLARVLLDGRTEYLPLIQKSYTPYSHGSLGGVLLGGLGSVEIKEGVKVEELGQEGVGELRLVPLQEASLVKNVAPMERYGEVLGPLSLCPPGLASLVCHMAIEGKREATGIKISVHAPCLVLEKCK